MLEIKETLQININFEEQAFLLQFAGDEYDVRKKLGLDSLCYYGDPVNDMKQTGLFGILDALVYLGLTKNEIMDFYIHGHVEPYTDPYEFTRGIIEIIYGMPKTEIKNKYGYYLKNDCIEKLPKFNRNIQMLMSFCYDKDDIYEFVFNKDDLYSHFSDNYDRKYHHWDNNINEKNFQRIDGKLFRTVRFLVLHGYDFPESECLFNEQINDIVFKQTNSKNTFVLNKEYAREMSDNLLSFVCFLKRNNYKFLNPEYMFNPKYDNITIIDPNGKQIEFKHDFLESNVNKYTDILLNLNVENLEVPDIISLCDKRVNKIGLWCLDSSGREHRLTIKRDILLSISSEWFRVIKRGFNLGFAFLDSDNLFNMKEKVLKVIDPNGNEQFVIREQFNGMIDIITKCMQYGFDINLNQLFDQNECMVELFDKHGKKALVNRNRITHMMNTFSILTENGYNFKDYDNLFDENKPYIVVYDKQNQERFLSRKQINKMLKVEEISAKDEENLTDNEKELLFTMTQFLIKRKLYEWLPYTTKKWIPSSAVINKIPAEKSYEYFYNNNYARLKILKDEFEAKSYDEMEGIVSLGYILGLFDSKESTSEKAMNYIIDYFLKKGITADELHTTYGAIDLKKGYDKKFADFFMQNYAINSESFIEPDLGTNMTGELFERFDEVLESRPEKRIKTRTINKLLTPIDAMASITNIKIDREILGEKADDERYIHLAQLLLKFGASSNEIKWAIDLYEQALAIDEQKVSIPQIEDLKSCFMKFNSHLKSDPQAFVSGRKTNCCSRYGGYAQDRLTHVITDPNWRYVTFTSSNRTFFDGLVWYDKEEQVVCIDNVEGQFSKNDKKNTKSVAMMADTVIRYADGIYSKMNELNIPCKKVNVGNDPGTASWEIFRYAREQELICDDNKPCNYPERNNITTDANKQFTITDEKTLKLRRKC